MSTSPRSLLFYYANYNCMKWHDHPIKQFASVISDPPQRLLGCCLCSRLEVLQSTLIAALHLLSSICTFLEYLYFWIISLHCIALIWTPQYSRKGTRTMRTIHSLLHINEKSRFTDSHSQQAVMHLPFIYCLPFTVFLLVLIISSIFIGLLLYVCVQ